VVEIIIKGLPNGWPLLISLEPMAMLNPRLPNSIYVRVWSLIKRRIASNRIRELERMLAGSNRFSIAFIKTKLIRILTGIIFPIRLGLLLTKNFIKQRAIPRASI